MCQQTNELARRGNAILGLEPVTHRWHREVAPLGDRCGKLRDFAVRVTIRGANLANHVFHVQAVACPSHLLVQVMLDLRPKLVAARSRDAQVRHDAWRVSS